MRKLLLFIAFCYYLALPAQTINASEMMQSIQCKDTICFQKLALKINFSKSPTEDSNSGCQIVFFNSDSNTCPTYNKWQTDIYYYTYCSEFNDSASVAYATPCFSNYNNLLNDLINGGFSVIEPTFIDSTTYSFKRKLTRYYNKKHKEITLTVQQVPSFEPNNNYTYTFILSRTPKNSVNQYPATDSRPYIFTAKEMIALQVCIDSLCIDRIMKSKAFFNAFLLNDTNGSKHYAYFSKNSISSKTSRVFSNNDLVIEQQPNKNQSVRFTTPSYKAYRKVLRSIRGLGFKKRDATPNDGWNSSDYSIYESKRFKTIRFLYVYKNDNNIPTYCWVLENQP